MQIIEICQAILDTLKSHLRVKQPSETNIMFVWTKFSKLKKKKKRIGLKVLVERGGGVSKWAYFFIQLSSMFSLICLLYRVIQDFVQRALFSEIQAVRSEWGKYV